MSNPFFFVQTENINPNTFFSGNTPPNGLERRKSIDMVDSFSTNQETQMDITMTNYEDMIDEEEKDVWDPVMGVNISKKDLYSNLLDRESCDHYNPNSRYIKYRKIVVDWLVDVATKCQINNLTFHTAVRFMDRILGICPNLSRNYFQITGMCCILISAKFLEYENVPSIRKLNKCAHNVYSLKSIQTMELLVLDCLDWRLCEVTSLHLLDFYLCDGVVFTTDCIPNKVVSLTKIKYYVRKYISFFLEMCLQEYSFQIYLPSILAATIVLCSRKLVKLATIWNDELVKLTHYSFSDLETTYNHLLKHYFANFPTDQPVYRDSPTNVADSYRI